MHWEQISTFFGKVLPIAFVLGLLGDWLRLRFAHRAEERKHIARAISDLFQLRYIVRSLPEFPKLASRLVPKELSGHFPENVWRSIDFTKAIPVDQEFPSRFRKAVEEIAGFRPLLAFQLRDKERCFDLRNFLSNQLSQAPGSALVANQVTEIVDREAEKNLDGSLLLLARAHSCRMHYAIWRTLRKRRGSCDMIPTEIRKVFQEQILQLIKAVEPQLLTKPTPPRNPA